MKKKLIVVILLFSTLFSVVATGMPVIDVAAIAQAVQSAMTQVNQWNQQLKQWQSEYERIKKAAEQISSGNFTSVVTGLASLSGQMSGWAESLGWAGTMEFLDAAEDGSYSLLSMANNAQLSLYSLEALAKKIETKAKANTDDDKVISGFIGAESWLDFTSILLNSGGSLGLDIANLTNDVVALSQIGPSESVAIYEKALAGTMSKLGYNSYDDLLSALSKAKEERSQLYQDLAKINPSENVSAYSQMQTKIEEKDKEIAEMEAFIEQYNTVKAKIQSVKAEQEKYQQVKTEKAQEKIAAEKAKAESEAQAARAEAFNEAFKEALKETKKNK